jgi:predicted nucleic acid-binding protein
MTSYLIDINVWLALTWDGHPHHDVAGVWFESIDEATLLFCRITMLGLLRLLTNEQVMGQSVVTVREALGFMIAGTKIRALKWPASPSEWRACFAGLLRQSPTGERPRRSWIVTWLVSRRQPDQNWSLWIKA